MAYPETEFISLRNDLLFHMVFTRNAEALAELLSALLGIPRPEIARVEVLNPMQYSEALDTKLTILDLKVHLNGENFVLVEMQVRRFPNWTNRVLAYASRQMADQVHGNFDYGRLQPVIQISIMDHSLFPDHRRFFDKFLLRDPEGYVYTDKLQLCVMDLTQIGQATEADRRQGLVTWARAFRANTWEEVETIEDVGVKEAAKTMELILSNPTERDMIRARMDAEIDWRTMMNAERREGRREGHREGVQQGRREGVQQGQIMLLSELVKDGFMTLHAAAQRVGLSDNEFEKLAEAFL